MTLILYANLYISSNPDFSQNKNLNKIEFSTHGHQQQLSSREADSRFHTDGHFISCLNP